MASLHESSAYYGQEMVNGWQSGLVKAKSTVVNSFEVNQHVYRLNGDEHGDMDCVIKLNTALRIAELFVAGKFFVRSPHKNIRSKYYIAEVKRTAVREIQIKAHTFVTFYRDIFSERSNVDFRRIDRDTLHMIKDKSTVLLFVFNGVDSVQVENVMKSTINKVCGNNDMMIEGHRVACVWASSTDIIGWSRDIDLDRSKIDLVAQQELIHAQELEIAQLRAALSNGNYSIPAHLSHPVNALSSQAATTRHGSQPSLTTRVTATAALRKASDGNRQSVKRGRTENSSPASNNTSINTGRTVRFEKEGANKKKRL